MTEYLDGVTQLLDKVFAQEREAMEAAADLVAGSIAEGRVIHMFGAGHSHMLCEEMFYRAGGLAAISPVFDENLMLHNGALRSSRLEKMTGYAASFLPAERFAQGDVVVVISTSGRNGVPVDVALWAKECGARVVALTSVDFSKSQPSRHSSGKRLFEVADLVLDNHCPPGDTILQLANGGGFAPPSTVVGAVMLQSVMAAAVRRLEAQGTTPPVFASGNLDGAEAHNQALVERYCKKVIYYR